MYYIFIGYCCNWVLEVEKRENRELVIIRKIRGYFLELIKDNIYIERGYLVLRKIKIWSKIYIIEILEF